MTCFNEETQETEVWYVDEDGQLTFLDGNVFLQKISSKVKLEDLIREKE